MSFSQPAGGGDSFTPAEHFGNLVLIYPKSYNPEETTTKGVTKSADADVVVIDKLGPDGQPLAFRDVRLFGNLAYNVRFLTEPNGSPRKYLGRIGQGENTRGTPPWILIKWTDADVAMATPVAAAFEAGQFAVATPNPMQPPAPATPATAPTTAPAWAPPVQAAATPTPAAAPPAQWTPPPPVAPAIDPNLVAFLASKGVTVQPGMDQATCEAIARSFQ